MGYWSTEMHSWNDDTEKAAMADWQCLQRDHSPVHALARTSFFSCSEIHRIFFALFILFMCIQLKRLETSGWPVLDRVVDIGSCAFVSRPRFPVFNQGIFKRSRFRSVQICSWTRRAAEWCSVSCLSKPSGIHGSLPKVTETLTSQWDYSTDRRQWLFLRDSGDQWWSWRVSVATTGLRGSSLTWKLQSLVLRLTFVGAVCDAKPVAVAILFAWHWLVSSYYFCYAFVCLHVDQFV